MRGLRFGAMFAVLLLLTACTKPTPGPSATEEGRCLPNIPGELAGYVQGTNGEIRKMLYVSQGTCAGEIATAPVDIGFRLPAEVTEKVARAALKTEGAPEPAITFRAGTETNLLFVSLPAGQAGDVVAVQLKGPVAKGGADATLGFRLTRRLPPVVQVEMRSAKGEWVPLVSGTSLPKGAPISLRFRLSPGLDVAQATERLREAVKDPIEQKGPDLLEVTVAAPPPRLFFNLTGIGDRDGFETENLATVVYFGTAPVLAALDPATGEDKFLAEMPVDIQEARLSPDGKSAVLSALDPTAFAGHSIHIADTASGKSVFIGNHAMIWRLEAAWNGGKVLVPAGSRVFVHDLKTGRTDSRTSAARDWGAVSWDHKYLFGYTVQGGPENKWAVTVVLHDTAAGTEQIFKDAVSIVRPFHAPIGINHAWSRDGLLLNDVQEVDANRVVQQRRTVRLDPASGSLTPTAEPIRPLMVGPWVGDGQGQWQYQAHRDWGPVTVKKGDGSGQATFGKGLIVGWRPDGKLLVVRWENADHRRYPPGP